MPGSGTGSGTAAGRAAIKAALKAQAKAEALEHLEKPLVGSRQKRASSPGRPRRPERKSHQHPPSSGVERSPRDEVVHNRDELAAGDLAQHFSEDPSLRAHEHRRGQVADPEAVASSMLATPGASATG